MKLLKKIELNRGAKFSSNEPRLEKSSIHLRSENRLSNKYIGAMNFDKFVFEIPIYRLSEEKYDEELHKEIISLMRSKEEFKELFGQSLYEEKYIEHYNRIRARKRYLWEYNEIIGWIGIYFFSNDIRAEYYKVNSKRIRKGVKSKFDWMGKFFEIRLDGIESSVAIFELVERELLREMKANYLRNRFIDLSKFYKIGKHLNWVTLMIENR